MDNIITSLDNSKIKQVIKLRKASSRKKEDLIIIEGLKEVSLALRAQIKVQTVFYCRDFSRELPKEIDNSLILEVDKKVFEKMSYRENPDGILVLAQEPKLKLENIKLSKNPLIVILEAVEKPGNLGAILRSADASGVDAVIISDPRTDIYNPNVIRASLGTVFINQVVLCSIDESITWLKQNNIKSFATTPHTSNIYTNMDYKDSCAILIGTEHEGLSNKWLSVVDEKIKIPMKGSIDSLNASVSAAVVLFEVIRQRN